MPVPGVNGTMTLIGLLGYGSCAVAESLAAPAVTSDSTHRTAKHRSKHGDLTRDGCKRRSGRSERRRSKPATRL